MAAPSAPTVGGGGGGGGSGLSVAGAGELSRPLIAPAHGSGGPYSDGRDGTPPSGNWPPPPRPPPVEAEPLGVEVGVAPPAPGYPFRLADGSVLYVSAAGVTWDAPSARGGGGRAAGGGGGGDKRGRGAAAAGSAARVTIRHEDLIGARLVHSSDPTSAAVEVGELVEPPPPRRLLPSLRQRPQHAAAAASSGVVTDRVVRLPRLHALALVSRPEAVRLVDLLRLLALGSTTRARRLRVVLNPHSGKKVAVPLYVHRMAPLLALAGMDADVTVTDHAGHAIECGKDYDPGRYEGCVVMGGDGTVQEFLSGLLSRRDWRTLIRRVPICSVACGTQNALARGVRTTLPEYAAYCVIKHKLRPLDAMLVANSAGLRTISLCGTGFGLAADIATDSEAYRWLGIARYAFLKVRHSAAIMLGLTRHAATVQMDSDVGMDELALAVYFAKPFTTVRLPRRGGGFIISRKPLEDPELEDDDAVRARLMEEGFAAPRDVRLLRTGSMLPGAHAHFAGGGGGGGSTAAALPGGSGGSGGGGPGDRVARVQLSTTALEPFLGAAEASAVVTEAAQQVKHRVLKAGGGRIMGVDSGVLVEMQAAGVDTAALARRPAPPPAAVAAALPPESAELMPPAAVAATPQSSRPRSAHYPQQSLMSAPAERRAGGGIVTVDVPTATLVAEMRATKKLLLAAQGDALLLAAAAGEGGGAAAEVPHRQQEAVAIGPPPASPVERVQAEAEVAAGKTSAPLQARAAELAQAAVVGAAGGGGGVGGLTTAQPPSSSLPAPVVLTREQLRSVSPATPLQETSAAAAVAPRVSQPLAGVHALATSSSDEGDDAEGGGGRLISRRAISPRFGELVRCTRGCATCRKNGRLRYIGHRREAILVAPEPSASRFPASSLGPSAAESAVGAYAAAASGGGSVGSNPAGASGGFPVDRFAPQVGDSGVPAGGVASTLRATTKHFATASTVAGLPETFGEPRYTAAAPRPPEAVAVMMAPVVPDGDATNGVDAAATSAARQWASGGTGAVDTVRVTAVGGDSGAGGAALTTPTGAHSESDAGTGGTHTARVSVGSLPSPGHGAGSSEGAPPAAATTAASTAVTAGAVARTTLASSTAAPDATSQAAAAAVDGEHFTHAARYGEGVTYSTKGAWATDIPRVPSRSRSRAGLFGSRSISRSREVSGTGEPRPSLAAAAAAGSSSQRMSVVEALARVPEHGAGGGDETAAGAAVTPPDTPLSAAADPAAVAGPVLPPPPSLTAAAAGEPAAASCSPVPWYKRLSRRVHAAGIGGGSFGVPPATGAGGAYDESDVGASTANVVTMTGAGPYPTPFAMSYAAPFEPLLRAPALAVAPPADNGIAQPVPEPPPQTATEAALAAGAHAHTRRNFERRFDRGNYITIGMLNVVPEAKYQHPSDSYLDVVFARRGGPLASLGLMLRYVVGRERGSPLYDYVKVRSVLLTPDDPAAALNVDGEVLPGPGPFTVHLLPSLLTMYGEY